MRKYVLPTIAIIGALLGLLVVAVTQKSVPVPPILFPPPQSPYPNAIAGAGIIEASSQNISIGCPFNEVIDTVFVVEGDFVEVGQPLFQLDLRNFIAQEEVAKASLQAAITTLEDKATQVEFYRRLQDKQAVSQQIIAQYAVCLPPSSRGCQGGTEPADSCPNQYRAVYHSCPGFWKSLTSQHPYRRDRSSHSFHQRASLLANCSARLSSVTRNSHSPSRSGSILMRMMHGGMKRELLQLDSCGVTVGSIFL